MYLHNSFGRISDPNSIIADPNSLNTDPNFLSADPNPNSLSAALLISWVQSSEQHKMAVLDNVYTLPLR